MGRTNKTEYRRYISSDEVNRIRESVKEQPKWALLFGIMAFMGLRVSEVCSLRYDDIVGDLDKLRVKVAKTKPALIKERIIPDILKPKLRKWLLICRLLQYDTKSPYIFFPANNRSKSPHIMPQTVRWKILRIRRELGIDDTYYYDHQGRGYRRVTSHSFRHYFLSQLFERTNNAVLCQRIIGHKRLETTLQYVTLAGMEEREREAVNSL